MENLIKDFLKQKRFAVIGSFRNETKIAYKILVYLINKGYDVYPVNLTLKEVRGRTCYKSISDIPYKVDVADIVTPPLVSENILKECFEKGIRKVWLQPGAESRAAIQFCHDFGIEVVHGACVMLESLK